MIGEMGEDAAGPAGTSRNHHPMEKSVSLRSMND